MSLSKLLYHQYNTGWDEFMQYIQITFNLAKHWSKGMSPSELFLGYLLSNPLEHKWNIDTTPELSELTLLLMSVQDGCSLNFPFSKICLAY